MVETKSYPEKPFYWMDRQSRYQWLIFILLVVVGAGWFRYHHFPVRERFVHSDGVVDFKKAFLDWESYSPYADGNNGEELDRIREAVADDCYFYCFTNTGKVYVLEKSQYLNLAPTSAVWDWQGDPTDFPYYRQLPFSRP